MSATNPTTRGGDGVDNFPTPASVTQRILRRLGAELPGGWWVEPTAGDGAIIRAVNAMRSDVQWTAFEIREECELAIAMACQKQNYTRVTKADIRTGDDGNALALSLRYPARSFSVAILNPPFKLAQPIIEQCLIAADHVVALERLNFLSSKKRAAWWRSNMPDVYILPDRPSFTGDGKTDSIEYCWLHWSPLRGGCSGRVEVLPLPGATP